MRALGVVLLVVGYPVAVAVLTRYRAVLRERRWAWHLALEAGTALVAVGWLALGRLVPTVLNGLGVLAFAVLWTWTGRRRR